MDQLTKLLGKLQGKKTWIVLAAAGAWLLGDGSLTDAATYADPTGGEVQTAGILAAIATVRATLGRFIAKINDAMNRLERIEEAVKVLNEGAPK